MKLFYRKYGEGTPIIILHGLYGSSDNWVTIGRALSSTYEVWLLDQRNHGKSPHNKIHTYEAMQSDLLEFMNLHNIEKAIIIGHSMGGKTAMRFAIEHPEKINKLIVIDIAPKSYLFSLKMKSETLNHKAIMESMLNLNFDGINHRNELEDMMSKQIRNTKVRQFILKNVKRQNDNSFGWQLNIRALYDNLEHILDGFSEIVNNIGEEVTGFPILFVKGAESKYIDVEDIDRIYSLFPYAELRTIKNAGHWLHAEEPDELLKILFEFIQA